MKVGRGVGIFISHFLLENDIFLIRYKYCQTKNMFNMKKLLLKVGALGKSFLLVKKIFALFLCGFFTLLTLDWLVGLFAFFIDSPYRGAFFPEVWSITQLLFTWMPEHTLTRYVVGIFVGILTFGVPMCVVYLSFSWLGRLLTKK